MHACMHVNQLTKSPLFKIIKQYENISTYCTVQTYYSKNIKWTLTTHENASMKLFEINSDTPI